MKQFWLYFSQKIDACKLSFELFFYSFVEKKAVVEESYKYF